MAEPTASRSLLPTCPPIDGPLAYRATETAERSYREWKASKQAAQRKLLQQEADLAKTLQLHVRTPQLLPVYLRDAFAVLAMRLGVQLPVVNRITELDFMNCTTHKPTRPLCSLKPWTTQLSLPMLSSGCPQRGTCPPSRAPMHLKPSRVLEECILFLHSGANHFFRSMCINNGCRRKSSRKQRESFGYVIGPRS